MSLPRPVLELTVDGTRYDGPSAAIISLECELASGRWHAGVDIELASQSPLLGTAVGVDASLALGYDDEVVTVFSGYVDEVVGLPTGARLRLRSASTRLAGRSVAQAYVSQSIAEIAGDLIDKGGADAGQLEGTVKLAIFYADLPTSIWQLLVRLAELDDLRLAINADGEVELNAWVVPGPATSLRHGADILLWDLAQREVDDAPQAVLLGAGSALDSEKWHVFVKSPGEAVGRNTSTAVLARDEDALEAYNSAATARKQRSALAGSVLIRGNPEIRPGSTISLQDVPGHDEVDLVVNRVLHSYRTDSGFVSALSVEQAQGGG